MSSPLPNCVVPESNSHKEPGTWIFYTGILKFTFNKDIFLRDLFLNKDK